MARSSALAQLFEHPTNAVHQQYEICRAYFLQRLTAQSISRQFRLHVGTVQAVVRDFAQDPDLNKVFQLRRVGRKTSPKRDAVFAQVRQLRLEGKSLGEIHRHLNKQEPQISQPYLATILRSVGEKKGARGAKTPLPGERARDGSEVPAIADVRQVCLQQGRSIQTQVAGLFFFLPLLLESGFVQAVEAANYPGTNQIPATQALLALLTPKLLGKRRVSHINDLNTDEGAGLFAGLNVLPKTTYATDYSYRTQREMNERFVDELVKSLCLDEPPQSFNLDFHAIPFRGEKSDLENHWVPKHHRGQPAVMAFVAQESQRRVMCYATANVVRDEADEMVIRFVDHWKERSGHYPSLVLFDSRATTYPRLSELTARHVGFITVRRRGVAMIKRIQALPAKQWKQCQVTQAKGKKRRVRYIEETTRLEGYEGTLRQIAFDGLGHESPTFLVTNDFPQPLTARQVLQTYAQRNHIEHSLGEKITFFHLDCLSSEVRLNVDFDLTLTVVAAMLYQQLAQRLKGFTDSTPLNIFRKFINTQGHIEITSQHIIIHLEKRSHNPILIEAGFDKKPIPVPWFNGKTLLFRFP